jgi:PBSX family phage portal protein
MGNGYLEEIPSRQKGYAVTYASRPAIHVRRIMGDKYGSYQQDKSDLEEIPNPVVHFMYHDIEQDFYGKPYYLAALAAANLNQKATHFRSLYYDNGNHAGFILYLNDPAHSLEDVKALKKALKESKGPGAFRNLFFYAPKGKKDGMQVIPVESAQAQDKFLDIKNVSRDDIMAMHRIPPNMMAVQSTNAGGFGNITEARDAMILNEIVPIARLMQATHPILQFDLPTKSSKSPT